MGRPPDPVVQNGQILPYDAPVAGQQLVSVLQGQGGHRLIQQPAADEVIVPVDEAALQHLRIPGGDPAQPDPGQGEHLGHTADADALLIQVHDGGAVAVLLGEMAVHLVAQDIGPVAAGDGDDLLQHLLGHEGPGGVVGVVQADELDPFLGQLLQAGQVGQKAVVRGQGEQFHLGPQGVGDGVQLLIGGQDGDDLVPRLHQGAEQVVVGSGGAVGGGHLLRAQVPVQPADPLQKGGLAEDVPVGQPPGAQGGEKGLLVLAGELEQLVQGDGVHTGLGDVVPGPHLILIHPFFYQKGFDLHVVKPP